MAITDIEDEVRRYRICAHTLEGEFTHLENRDSEFHYGSALALVVEVAGIEMKWKAGRRDGNAA